MGYNLHIYFYLLLYKQNTFDWLFSFLWGGGELPVDKERLIRYNKGEIKEI